MEIRAISRHRKFDDFYHPSPLNADSTPQKAAKRRPVV
jgi:hypothetical protein